MRTRFSALMLLIAGLLTTGSQWDLAQVYAWGKMMATYARTAPLSEAVRLTFQPENLCGICKAVQNVRQQEDNPAFPGNGKPDRKIVLVYQPVQPVVLTAPSVQSWHPDDVRAGSADKAAPPLPPPRRAAA